MKIGVSTGFADRLGIDVIKALEIVSQTPIKIVELWSLFYGKLQHFNWRDKNEIEEIKKTLKIYNIEVYSIHAPFSYEYELATNNKEHLNLVLRDTKEIISVAKELGARCVVVHPASKPGTSMFHISQKEYEQRINNAKFSLEELAEFVIKNNYEIKIAIENQLPHITFGYFDEIDVLINNLRNYNLFGICFDTSHAEMAYSTDITKFQKDFNRIVKYIISTHISDTDKKTDAHLVPGEGQIKWNQLAYELKKISIEVPMILEVLTPLNGKTITETLNEAYKRMKLILKDWW